MPAPLRMPPSTARRPVLRSPSRTTTRPPRITLAPTLCGTITPNSESDFLTFTLKESSKSLAIDFTGQVTLKVDVQNQTVILGGPISGKVPFVKNARYTIEVKGTTKDNATPWRVDLVEK